MKRVLFIAALLLAAASAFAFNPAPASPRVGVLRVSEDYGHSERSVANLVVSYLRDELRQRGVDAYDTRLTYEQVSKGDGEDADYYVEIVGAGGESGSLGGIGVGTWDAGVSVDVIVSHVAAELRVYDGHTGQLLKSHQLNKRNTAVMPTSVYLGGSHVFAALTVPFVQHAQYKRISRSAARDAAQMVIATLGPPAEPEQ